MKNNKNTATLSIAALLTAAPTLALSQQLPEQFFFDDPTETAEIGTTSDGKQRFEIRGGYAIIEGDIVLGKVLSDGAIEQPLVPRGIGRDASLDRWTDGIAYYQIDSGLNGEDRAKVVAAVAHWNQFSSISMVERTVEYQDTVTDYILFEPSSGCASWVGKIGGEQPIWVGAACTAGSVIHEIGHAMGLFHEHTRSDRDSFINVEWDNILDGKDFNFDIMDIGASDLGEYDYGSIMHYGPRFFSKNGVDTITAPDGVEVGQREKLSPIDLASINQMYGTDLMLASSVVDGAETQVNVSINNVGENGAHDIVFRLPLSDDATPKSFLGESWSCGAEGNDIVCNLPTLADGAETSLAIVIQSGSGNVNSAASFVTSKTFDFDLGNNGVVPDSFAQQGSGIAEPELGAGTTDENNTTGGSETAGGGTTGGTQNTGTTGGSAGETGTTGAGTPAPTTGGTTGFGTTGGSTTGGGTTGGTQNTGTTGGSAGETGTTGAGTPAPTTGGTTGGTTGFGTTGGSTTGGGTTSGGTTGGSTGGGTSAGTSVGQASTTDGGTASAPKASGGGGSGWPAVLLIAALWRQVKRRPQARV